MRRDDSCPCGRALYGEIERDTGLCGSCADREYERHIANREWEYFHPPAERSVEEVPIADDASPPSSKTRE